MQLPEKVSKRNLLQYAQSIGGEKMYLSFIRAMRAANLYEKSVLGQRQLDNIVNKLAQDEEFTLGKQEMKKLISQRERRRQAYVRMAIEGEDDEMSGPVFHGGLQPGQGRYDVKTYRAQSRSRPQTSASAGALSSVARAKKSFGRGGEISKDSGAGAGPMTSIGRIKRQ